MPKFTSETAPRGGNPLAGKRQALMAALMRCVSEEDFERLARKLVKAAEAGLDAGEVKQVAELFDRLLGKPAQSVEVGATEGLSEVLERLAAAKERNAQETAEE